MVGATFVTCCVSALVFGFVFARVTPRDERWLIVACIVLTMPMSWIMFHGVRLPLDEWLKATLGENEILRCIRTAYAPLTEEPAKLWPLLLPWIRRAVTPQTATRYALALGVGFAFGEVFTVAGLIVARQPQVAALPWYQLGGFINERLMTFVLHGGMTAVALTAWQRGAGLVPGLLLAMLIHWLVNFPITMAQRGWLGPDAAFAQILVSMWVVACFMLALGWLLWLDIGVVGLGTLLYGRTACTHCGLEFDRRFLGVNLGSTRYECCPHCRRWQWTTGRIKCAV